MSACAEGRGADGKPWCYDDTMRIPNWWAVVGVLCLSATLGLAQRGAGGVAHSLFGDLKVAGMGETTATTSFNVVLREAAGQMIGRMPTPPGGRFRFNNVANGEYILSIEVQNEVVYEERLIVFEGRSTDIRKDIELQWSTGEPTEVAGGTVYDRSAANQARLATAQERMASGDLKKAADELESLVKADPGDFEVWTELGTAEFMRERYGQADRAYRQALILKSDYFPAQLNLGKLQLAQKKFDEAVPVLEAAVQAKPDSAEANHLLGEALLGIRKGSRAVGYLETAIRLDPVGKAEIHLRLAQLYDAAGMKSRASAEYRAFLEKKPDAPRRKDFEKYIAANP